MPQCKIGCPIAAGRLIGIGALTLVAAACASDGYYANDPYSHDGSYSGDYMSQAGIFSGIDGAREAHRLYPEATAEDLDGDCEREVRIERGETLSDIAEYCDAPVAALVEANPQIADPRYIAAGQLLHVPPVRGDVYQGSTAYRTADYSTGSVDAVIFDRDADGRDYYVVRRGDTLAEIAYRFDVPLRSIRRLNPHLQPRRLAVGDRVYLPRDALYADRPHESPISTAPESRLTGRHAGSPFMAAVQDSVYYGDKVTLAAEGFPENTPVTIYGGDNRHRLEKILEVRSGPGGRFVADVDIPDSATGETVLYVAAIEDGPRTIFSERVRILTRAYGYDGARTPDTLERGIERRGKIGGFFSQFRRDGGPVKTSAVAGGQSAFVGILTNEGEHCPTLRDDSGNLFTLVGDLQGFDDGDRVRLRGVVQADNRICAQGETVQIYEIAAAPW